MLSPHFWLDFSSKFFINKVLSAALSKLPTGGFPLKPLPFYFCPLFARLIKSPQLIKSSLLAEKTLEADHDAGITQWRLQIEQLQYEADRAERRYRTVEPENRLVGRTLESHWEVCLTKLKDAEKELDRMLKHRPTILTEQQRARIRTLGKDLKRVWDAPTTSHSILLFLASLFRRSYSLCNST